NQWIFSVPRHGTSPDTTWRWYRRAWLPRGRTPRTIAVPWACANEGRNVPHDGAGLQQDASLRDDWTQRTVRTWQHVPGYLDWDTSYPAWESRCRSTGAWGTARLRRTRAERVDSDGLYVVTRSPLMSANDRATSLCHLHLRILEPRRHWERHGRHVGERIQSGSQHR